MTRRRHPWLAWSVVAVVLFFLFVPVIMVVLFSFNAGGSTSLPLEGLSTRWYGALFDDAAFVAALVNSAKAAIATVAFVLVTGTAAAIALARRSSRVLDALSTFVVAPLVVPGLFLGVALFSLFTELRVTRSLTTVIIGHCVVTLPLVVLIVNARLANIDRSMLEAARDLGATWLQSFRKVLLPLMAPALVGTSLLVVAWSMDEVVVTLWTAGGDTTIPVMIWARLRQGLDPSVNAIASIVLAVTTLTAALATRFVTARELTS
jgi:spermidine/putrescine transport system permease protein